LQNIARNYNKEKNKSIIKLNLPKKELWNKLIEVNYDKCSNNEYCWLKQNYMKINSKNISELKENFRPDKPEEWKDDPDKWLNTYNILNVMKQYEDKYKNFKFVGVFPIDFMTKIDGSCVSKEMCSLNLNDMIKKKITKIGFIFNLDKHYQSGSHWVSLFMNLNKNNKNYGAYYYDSNGTPPPIEIKNYIKIVKNKLNKNDNKFKFKFNKKRHQYSNSECGMFSLYFMNESLKNVSFEKFINNKKINDKFVFKLRDKYYSKTK
jgi:hypothetical protein